MRSKGGAKEEKRARKLRKQRRMTLIRIMYWRKSRKVRYDGKDRRKYRNEARASKRWLQRRIKKEAEEVSSRERKRRTRETRDKDGRRKGGAGRGGMARPVLASSTEENSIRKIGVPQHTWGDGSCWLWAVAGARGKLEGREGPTENDLILERE
eukprot:6179311-Pleurochrysis_carterae.AAC.4